MKKFIPILAVALLFTACSTTQQQEFATTAETFGTDVKSYAQTLANAVFTVSNVVTQNSGVLLTTLQAWGLLPANSSQLATYNSVIAAVKTAGASAQTLNSVLTTISATGTVPAVVAPSTTFYHSALPLRAPFGEHDPGHVLLAKHRSVNYTLLAQK